MKRDDMSYFFRTFAEINGSITVESKKQNNIYKFIMKKTILALCTTALVCGCAGNGAGDNPLLAEFNTPFGVPPFDEIKPEHYMPAFELGMEQQKAEVEAIVNSTEPATFENTVAALDQCGALLNKVQGLYRRAGGGCPCPGGR